MQTTTSKTVIRPTTMGLAMYNAARTMKKGSNTPLARSVRAKVDHAGASYSVVMPAVSVHFAIPELK